MAVWLFRRAGIVLTLFFRISYCEYDLLENLQPNTNDPPELKDFLRSVLHKKDEFKKIREAARYLQLPVSPVEENIFRKNQEDLRADAKPRSSKLDHSEFEHPVFRTSNKHHPLKRRSDNPDRPVNDVYPYMYDENENNVEPDDREERSSWKDVKERKHKYYNNLRNKRRYRRGLDLTDYSSDKDSERANIKIFPRSRTGFQTVPGDKYQQPWDASTNFNHRLKQRRGIQLTESATEDKSISDILSNSPLTERAIPEDYSAEHDILGFKAESLSDSITYTKNKKLQGTNMLSRDDIEAKDTANAIQKMKNNLDSGELLLDNSNFIDKTKKSDVNKGRKKRSMQLNIIDNNNLIKRITQDNSGKSIVLTLTNDNTRQTKEHSQRKAMVTPGSIIDFESLHKALHLGEPYMNIHNKPSSVVDILKVQEVLPEISIQLDKQNEKQNIKQNPNIFKESDPNAVALIYHADEEANGEKEYPVQPPSEQKKIVLEDVDEPTSALEQYELSTKPYIIVPKCKAIFSTFDILKGVTELLNPLDTTTNKANQFIVKETNDMVHGKNKKTLYLIDKRTAGVDRVKNQKDDMMLPSQKSQKFNNYDDAINSLQKKLNDYSRILSRGSPISNKNQKSEKNAVNLENTQESDYDYQDQRQVDSQSIFQGRKLQSFHEDELDKETDANDVVYQNTRYGYLDYENGRNNRIKEPGFTENKIRVKRGLTDLFGMKNDEDYSEDVLDDYNPLVKQERSDYSYEEEEERSAPAERQKYDNKNNNEQNPHQMVNDFITTQLYSNFTTKLPLTYGNSFNLSETSKTISPHLNRKTDNITKRSVKCTNCKDCENPDTKNEKCNNGKTNSGNGNNENCKNCNRKIRSPNTNEQKTIKSSTLSYLSKLDSPNSEALNNKYANYVKHTEILERNNADNIGIRNRDQANCSSLGANLDGNEKAKGFHSKTVANNTSSDNSKEPPIEEANSDQAVFQFDNHRSKTNSSCDEVGNLTKSPATIINSSHIENNAQLQERGPKQNTNSETEPEDDSDYGEAVQFAHHPLKTKNTSKNGKTVYNKNSNVNVDKTSTSFHTKYNQNEFVQNNQKPEHEELPDVETISDRTDEASLEQLFRENNNQENNQNLLAESTETNYKNISANIKTKISTQKITLKPNEDENNPQTPLLDKSSRNIGLNTDTRERKGVAKNPFENSEDEHSSSQVRKHRKDVIHPMMGKYTNKYTNTKENNFLLNSVANFADIVEEEVDNRRVNKRQTIEQKQWDKQDLSEKMKRLGDRQLHSIDTVNAFANDAPFEKFSKLNQGYWKKRPVRIINKLPYSEMPYNKNPSFHEHKYSHHNPLTPNINQDSNYADRRNIMQTRRLHYINTNNLRRTRRDQLSKLSEPRTGYNVYNDNVKEHRFKNLIANLAQRQPRNKGECTEKHTKHNNQKGGTKEWLGSKPQKANQKNCLLSQYTGLNPSFGLKPSKGSCNDEAEIEKGSKDYSQLHDALNGNLACMVVETTFKKVKEHQQLKKRFSHGLCRKHGFKNEMKGLNAFRNNETEGDVKRTEGMLQQIMAVLNKIILDQVRRRTCKHLPPELQKYLASITKVARKGGDEDTKISEEGSPLPLIKSAKDKEKPLDTGQGDFLFSNPENKSPLQNDEEEVKKKMRMIQGLLDKYKNMSGRCKTKVEDVEIYLKQHLCILKKILVEIKQQGNSQKNKPDGKCGVGKIPNKLKRKNDDVPSHMPVKQRDMAHYDQFYKKNLINKQLNSIGLGMSGRYKPTFNLDKLVEDTKTKLRYKNLHDKEKASKGRIVESKSKYRSEGDSSFEQLEEDYENAKNEHKREIIEHANRNKQSISEKYRKLVQAAESLRKKRESEERLGRLFGNPEKRSIRNENYETIKSKNKKYQDYSHVGFETPVVFSLKK